MIANVEKFKQHGQLGFGIWMDQDWRKNGWSDADVTKNYFTPEQFEKVKKDLDDKVRTADRLRAVKLKNGDEPDFIFSA